MTRGSPANHKEGTGSSVVTVRASGDRHEEVFTEPDSTIHAAGAARAQGERTPSSYLRGDLLSYSRPDGSSKSPRRGVVVERDQCAQRGAVLPWGLTGVLLPLLSSHLRGCRWPGESQTTEDRSSEPRPPAED